MMTIEKNEGSKENYNIIDTQELIKINKYQIRWEKHDINEISNYLKTQKKVSISKSQLDQTLIHKSISLIAKFMCKTKEQKVIRDLARECKDSWKKQIAIITKSPKDTDSEKKTSPNLFSQFNKFENPNVQVSKTNLKTDQPDLKNIQRNRALKSQYDILSDEEVMTKLNLTNPDLKMNSQKIVHKCLTVEHEIYSKCISIYSKTNDKYLQTIRTKILELKDPSNTDLKVKVLNNEITVKTFVYSSTEELNSNLDKMKEDALEYQLQANQSDFSIKNMNLTDSEFTCFRCKGKKIMISQRQMRCADEPMTVFFYCSDCGNRWRR